MKETLMRQIIAKQDELITLLDQASIRGWTNIMQKHKMNFYDEIADLRQQLKQAESEPKELAEIKEEDKTCRNCRNKVLSPISKPCSYCLGFDEWEPIK